jgi:predicted GH43/DUF377 family glycosyl hydrolase
MFTRFVQPSRGVTVMRVPDNPVVPVAPWTWRDRGTGTPCLVQIGNRVVIFCRGEFGSRDRIGWLAADAKSFEGENFREMQGNPMLDNGPAGDVDDLSVRYPSVVERAGVWYCFYEGRNERGESHICAALSRDGLRWTKYPRNPLFPGCEPAAVVTDNAFTVFHTRPDAGGHIFAACSPDGMSWTLETVPVFGPGAAGAWDGGSICSPRVHAEAGMFYLFYGARRDGPGPPESIGLAVSDNLRQWRRWPHNPLAVRGVATDWDGGGIWPGAPARVGEILYIPYEGCGHNSPGAAPPQVGMLALRGDLPRLDQPGRIVCCIAQAKTIYSAMAERTHASPPITVRKGQR